METASVYGRTTRTKTGSQILKHGRIEICLGRQGIIPETQIRMGKHTIKRTREFLWESTPSKGHANSHRKAQYSAVLSIILQVQL